ncbi:MULTISPECIES: hypothetical protein [unclassified Methylophaga]|jgi:hypothetical protein|uniref:hypothetical protein n=1 Tax=unclassified Methylophaga TaxID=2629249 RepID=UPI00259D2AFD|nr:MULTISPECIES: hypothetical protein [unclassified Methylophaga]|tara:strand:+ start:36749 stop:36982 length:234 start_codon:yes stop_codon:yes gene_type:complete
MNTSTLESLQSLIDTNIGLAFAFTLLIGAAIMDQKQYDDFNEQLGGENSKSALAFAEIFGAQDKKDDEDESVNDNSK